MIVNMTKCSKIIGVPRTTLRSYVKRGILHATESRSERTNQPLMLVDTEEASKVFLEQTCRSPEEPKIEDAKEPQAERRFLLPATEQDRERLLPASKVARLLGRPNRTVYGWIMEGALQAKVVPAVPGVHKIVYLVDPEEAAKLTVSRSRRGNGRRFITAKPGRHDPVVETFASDPVVETFASDPEPVRLPEDKQDASQWIATIGTEIVRRMVSFGIRSLIFSDDGTVLYDQVTIVRNTVSVGKVAR